MHEVFCNAIVKKYKASICSKATVFYVITTLLTFMCPLLVTYSSQGFWQKISYYKEQPDVHFKHKMLFILENRKLGSFIFWSTYPKLNKIITPNILGVPSIEHIEEDLDRDGRNDQLCMTIEVQLQNEDIMSVKMILIFDYKLSLYSHLQMESMAYIHHSSPLPGASFFVLGELSLQQKEPLRHTGKDSRYNLPVLDEPKNEIDFFSLEEIFLKYASRNVTTVLRNMYPVWKAGKGADSSFRIDLRILYPEESIEYKTGLWELLKWALVQYMALLAIFLYIFRHLQMYVFEMQVVPTVVVSPLKRDV